MASTILFKFRSGTTFEALPLPGSAARLFDVKKAIIKTKKLDSGSMDFDLAVRNADTNEEYADEGMVLPRGTRLIVGRLPAARGHGFLARMARNEQMGGGGATMTGNAQNQAYYTIDSRAQEEEDEEFVSAADEDKELAALQAVTNMQQEGPIMHGGQVAPSRGMQSHGSGAGRGGMGGAPPKPSFRPNADPELREQEKKLMPKKRATGIPRTFLSLSAPPKTENVDGEGESSGPMLQPNTLGFEELVNRGGGQSENTRGTRRDLDYCLKITSTTIPEHIQCGICQGVVKNAMLLPWDPEGRTTCETCIRDGLANNGFRCPLTGMDGVSPDDLLPNVGLRKAAELFVKGVMEKMDEIEQQQVEEEDTKEDTGGTEANILEGDGVEKGVIVSKKMATSRKKSDDDDPFGGGDDEFGGDVFAVEVDKPDGEDEADEAANQVEETKAKEEPVATDNSNKESDRTKNDKDGTNLDIRNSSDPAVKSVDKDMSVSTDIVQTDSNNRQSNTPKHPDTPSNQQNRRERRRGPPVGYAMGPAGGGGGQDQNSHRDGHDESGHGSRGSYGGRGGRGRDRRSHSPPPAGGRGRGEHRGRGGGRGRDRDRYGDRGGDYRHDGDDGSVSFFFCYFRRP